MLLNIPIKHPKKSLRQSWTWMELFNWKTAMFLEKIIDDNLEQPKATLFASESPIKLRKI